MTVLETAIELRQVANSFSNELLAADARAAARRPDAQTWSPKEVLGHLIDSAANNHPAVRARAGDGRAHGCRDTNRITGLRSQGYQDADWPHLVALWTHLNLHLADVIARIPPASTPCRARSATRRR